MNCPARCPANFAANFLAARQLIELLKRFVDVLIALAGRTGGLRRFVLIFFRVELEIKQAREIAPRAASRPAAPAAAAKRYLNLAERGLGAQQVLEGFLFVGKGILPFLLLQFFGGWAHGVGSRVHVLHKTIEFLVFLGKLAALHTSGERLRLIAQFGLNVGKELGGLGRLLFGRFLVTALLPGL